MKRKYSDFFEEAEKSLSPERIKRARERAKEAITQIRLAELRKKLGVNQEEVKGFTQSNVSRLEARNDMKLSTLIDYLHRLGMGLEIKAKKTESVGSGFVLLRA